MSNNIKITNGQLAAIALLGNATLGHYVIWDLAGDANKSIRQSIMTVLLGIGKIPVAKCGVTAMAKEFYELAGSALDGYTCEANREDKFTAWAKQMIADSGTLVFGRYVSIKQP